jgi:hypothetical protein
MAHATHQSLRLALRPLLLPNNQGEPCISSFGNDGFGSQIHQLIHHRIVAEAMHVPFCPWRLIEPYHRTRQLHPRAGSVEWTNQLNICGLTRLLTEDRNKDGDCKHSSKCVGCSVCNCPRLNASGVYDARLEHRILKAQLIRHVDHLRFSFIRNMTDWASSASGQRAFERATRHARDALRSRRALLHAKEPDTDCGAFYTPGLVHVALHARRGDVMLGPAKGPKSKVHRRVPNATYRAALLDTHNGLGTVSHQLHIFSEGVPSDFAAMVAPPLPPVALHLNGNDFTAWDCLGKADVLITSGSGTFSVNAGFYAADETAVLFLPDVNGSLHDMRHLVAAALPNHILLAPNGTLTRHARRVLRQRKAKSPRIHGMSYE